MGITGQKQKEGLPAAKDAVDAFQELGDEWGTCMAMCYLAELHVWQGHPEDWRRMSMFLPMASSHTAAAGYWAEEAQQLANKLGFEEGQTRMAHVLSHERVVKDASKRNVPFDYATWAEAATA